MRFVEELNEALTKYWNLFNNSFLLKVSLLVFVTLLNFIVMKDYVFWRDVARPLLYVNDSKTFFDLFNVIRYEGTPMLYHSILWVISKITMLTPAIALGFHIFVHFLISYLIIFVLRLPGVLKIILLFQLPMIAYLLYVRQYSIAVLFLLLISFLYLEKGRNSFWIYVSLFVLTQISIHCCVVMLVFLLFLSLDRYNEEKRFFHVYYLIPAIGLVLCIVQFIPPPGLIEGLRVWKPLFIKENLYFAKTLIWDIFCNNLIIMISLTSISYFVFAKGFKSNKKQSILILVCVGLLFISFFLLGAFKYSFNRHHWLLTYSLVSFLIILHGPTKNVISEISWKHICLIGVAIYSIINYQSLTKKYLVPFSKGKEVANYLDEHYPEKPLLAKVEFYIEPIILYSKTKTSYYSLGRQKEVKYTILNHESVDYTKFKDFIVVLNYSDLIADLENAPNEILEKEPILILSANKYNNDIGSVLSSVKVKGRYSLEFLNDFQGALFENYTLFKVVKGGDL